MNNNKEQVTILVSGASGIVGYGILKSLRACNMPYKLIGTTIYNDSIAPAFCDIFELAPKTSDREYIDWLLRIIQKYNVDMIIPSIEDDMIKWNEHRIHLEQSTTCILNNSDLITTCIDKWLFYQKLKKHALPYAIESRLDGTFEEFKEDFGLPFLLKPRKGFASRGIIKIEDEKTFHQNKENLGSILMAQPIIGNNDEEFTVSAFFDRFSTLKCYQQLKRKLSKEGFTEQAEVVELNGMASILQKLAEIFKPIGPTNFQFRYAHGQFKLLEINPRVSSATSIRSAFGYNEAKMCIEYFLNNKEIRQPIIKTGKAVRYTEDFIFYDSNII